MTTIAYKDGVIAYDSRSTMGDLISDDSTNKAKHDQGVFFVLTGAASDYPAFIENYHAKRMITRCGSAALVLDDGSLYYTGGNKEDGFFRHHITTDKVFAIGSGQDHAFTAMDMGATAVEAVRMAAKRDAGTGGRIRSYKIK